MIPFGEEILLGAVQGLTEFLPISSSGHLYAIESWLNSPLVKDLSFDILVHFATLIAVLWVFRSDFTRLIRSMFGGDPEERRLLLSVVMGAVPAGLAGLFLKDQIETWPHEWPYLVSVCWLVTALALITLKRPSKENRATITIGMALWIGSFQAVALLPGVSRSGITICAALWIGCKREEAAKFSFLCATPLIAGATMLQLLDLVQAGRLPEGATLGGYLAGSITALITGYFALRLLLTMLKRGALHWWAYYLVAIAVGYFSWVKWS